MIRNIIVSIGHWNRGIGYDNKLLWHIPADMKRFKKFTIGKGNNAVIMGKNTLLSLPKKHLPKRDNLVLSTTLTDDNKNYKVFNHNYDLEEYISKKNYDEIWVIGGEKIYEMAIKSNKIDYVYVTNVVGATLSDAYFPLLPKWYEEIERSKEFKHEDNSYFYQTYENKNKNKNMYVTSQNMDYRLWSSHNNF